MQKSKNTGRKYKFNLRMCKNLSVIDFFLLIVAMLVTISVFISALASMLKPERITQLEDKTFELDELNNKLTDSQLNSKYVIGLQSDNLVVDVEDLALNLRDYNIKLNLDDFENSINFRDSESDVIVDSTEELKLYTVDDFDEYTYITYANQDMTKFIELAIFSDFPENFDISVFGLSDSDLVNNSENFGKDDDDADAVNHSAGKNAGYSETDEVDKADTIDRADTIDKADTVGENSNHSVAKYDADSKLGTSETADNSGYNEICITNTISVKSGDTYMALTNLYNQGYMFISFTGFDNIPEIEKIADVNTPENAVSSRQIMTAEQAEPTPTPTVEDNNRSKTGEFLDNLKSRLEWTRLDTDKEIEIAGLGVFNISDIKDNNTVEDGNSTESQRKSLFYSSKDGLIRICDSDSSKVYFRIGSITNPNTGANLNKLVETDYPNMYKDINFVSKSEVGYGVMTVMTDAGMYVFKASDEIYSVDEISNMLINWLGITQDSPKLVTSDYVMDELSRVIDNDKIDELEDDLNNSESSDNVENSENTESN